MSDTHVGVRGQPDPDEVARNVVLDTMRRHVVTEEWSIRRGNRWVCRCGSTSSGRPITSKEHQAQAVLDALRRHGWSAGWENGGPTRIVVDGEVVPDREPASIDSVPATLPTSAPEG